MIVGGGGGGEGVVCHILGMLVIYVGVCGIGMVVYLLLVAISALGSECRNMFKWAWCGV